MTDAVVNVEKSYVAQGSYELFLAAREHLAPEQEEVISALQRLRFAMLELSLVNKTFDVTSLEETLFEDGYTTAFFGSALWYLALIFKDEYFTIVEIENWETEFLEDVFAKMIRQEFYGNAGGF